MARHELNRREFLRASAALAGTELLSRLALSGASAAAVPVVKRSAVDQVALGQTGIKLSRLGMGTGVDGGKVQVALGKENFVKVIRYAFDRGVTYFDTCDNYRTVDWMGDAIKGLPREKLFVQSKISGQPRETLAAIDAERKKLNTDYFDSMLIHSQIVADWTSMDAWKRVMDGFDEAKSRKWIRAKGVSCHNLPALRDATASPFNEVHLVRVNPQGKYVDGPSGRGYTAQETNPVDPVMTEIRTMRQKGRGVIGMKLIGNGLFTDPDDRDRAIRFAMACPDIDAVVIGFKNTSEVDEAIERIDRALAG
jgi:predicted aldo/keto reductase-like oxidoreductase